MRRMISMGVLVLVFVFGASPLPLARGQQGTAPAEPYFDMHDLEAARLSEGTRSEAREVRGTVTRVLRDRKREWVTAFHVRSEDGKDWAFDALKLKGNMRANVKGEFDAGIAKGDLVVLSVYDCGEKNGRIVIDAIAIFRPD